MDDAIARKKGHQMTQQPKIDPRYAFWRKRIEGQIKHTMNEHPEWFAPMDDAKKARCIRSTAKRIIGEIVAGTPTGDNAAEQVQTRVPSAGDDAVQLSGAASGGSGGMETAASQQPSSERELFIRWFELRNGKKPDFYQTYVRQSYDAWQSSGQASRAALRPVLGNILDKLEMGIEASVIAELKQILGK